MADYATAVRVRTALKDLEQMIEDENIDGEDELEAIREFVEPFLPPVVEVPADRIGERLGLRDKRDKRLRVGDEVHVVNSCRFGDPDGVVVGESERDPRNRVKVRLSGEFEGIAYEPSLYRVRRTKKARKPDEDSLVA